MDVDLDSDMVDDQVEGLWRAPICAGRKVIYRSTLSNSSSGRAALVDDIGSFVPPPLIVCRLLPIILTETKKTTRHTLTADARPRGWYSRATYSRMTGEHGERPSHAP